MPIVRGPGGTLDPKIVHKALFGNSGGPCSFFVDHKRSMLFYYHEPCAGGSFLAEYNPGMNFEALRPLTFTPRLLARLFTSEIPLTDEEARWFALELSARAA